MEKSLSKIHFFDFFSFLVLRTLPKPKNTQLLKHLKFSSAEEVSGLSEGNQRLCGDLLQFTRWDVITPLLVCWLVFCSGASVQKAIFWICWFLVVKQRFKKAPLCLVFLVFYRVEISKTLFLRYSWFSGAPNLQKTRKTAKKLWLKRAAIVCLVSSKIQAGSC